MQKLSIVIPVRNERETLPILFDELTNRFGSLADLEFEAVLVDDGSTDESWALMTAQHERDPRFRAVRLSRNFGHQAALTAGLDYASGDAVAVMDADLQDPPEVILRMVEEWRNGHDVVYGEREAREGETWFKLWTAKAFYWLMQRITDAPTPRNTGDFYLLSRRALDRLRAMREPHRYLRGMVFWLGYPRTAVIYRRRPRRAGHAKFKYRASFVFALDAIVSSSKAPLHIALYSGIAATALGGLLAVLSIVTWSMAPHAQPQWMALIAVVLFLGGVQLATLGILGLYVAGIHDATRQRPLYIVQEEMGARSEPRRETDAGE
jgi:glycosyltransferase involved in cell wall biosynthesis